MSWYYNSDTGAVQQQLQAVAWLDLHAGLGWHGPFATKQDALNFYTQGKAANPGWKAPSGLGSNIINSVATAAGNAVGQAGPVGNPLTGLAAIGDFFSRLSQANTWLRLGEGILGIMLIAVGVARMTRAVPAATRIAKAVT